MSVRLIRTTVLFATWITIPSTASAQLIDPPLEAFEEWVLGPEPIAVIGKDPQTEEEVIGSVRSVLVLPGGGALVSDGTDQSLRLYSETGVYRSRPGRKGDGPGEFNDLGIIGRTVQGGFWVFDRSQRRLTVFDSTGNVVEIRNPSVPSDRPTMFFRPDELGMDGSGRFLVSTRRSFFADVGTPDGVIYSDSIDLWLTGERPSSVELVATEYADDRFLIKDRCGGSSSGLPQGVRGHLVIHEGAVYYARSDSLSIRSIWPTDDPRPSIRASARSYALSDRSRENARCPRTSTSSGPNGTCERTFSHEAPKNGPILSDVRSGSDGLLWVSARLGPEPEDRRWLAFDTEGGPVASMSPHVEGSTLTIQAFGNRSIVLRRTNEFDEQWIEVWPLVPSG